MCCVCSIFGTYTAASDVKKTFSLPRTMMANSDLARIINSDEIQTKVALLRTPPQINAISILTMLVIDKAYCCTRLSRAFSCATSSSTYSLAQSGATTDVVVGNMQVRDARAGFAKPSRKRNPLKNLGTMLKLNPYIAQVSTLNPKPLRCTGLIPTPKKPLNTCHCRSPPTGLSPQHLPAYSSASNRLA